MRINDTFFEPGARIKGKGEAGQILRNSFTGFFETLFRTLCQDDPRGFLGQGNFEQS
ncbi:hypothetical protein [Mesorhizobium sp. GbtcB19]|uniref:hypothetical protein n=1 Tax=Mesorhizobium sp. GbtcB19 TaxID=2824764 RepID=UPI001C30842A|nr:hypothetical protein [Mesorhizobium sp. GbtcB19]